MRYLTVNKKEFDFQPRRTYSANRHDFLPTAYVVLTRNVATGLE